MFCVLGFQYTGIIWFLAPAVTHIIILMFGYIFGVAAALDPKIEVERENTIGNYGPRFLVQLATVVTASQLFMIGYAFFAGMVMLQAITIGMSVIVQKITSMKV
jgi:hypothetical protein